MMSYTTSRDTIDATLIKFTNIDPGQFPTAQKIMTFVGLILNWLILAMYASLLLYTACFAIIIFPINSAAKRKRKRSYNDSCTNFDRSYARATNQGIITMVGVCFTILIMTSAVGDLRPNFINGHLKELFIYSSFHLEPESCGIETASPGSKIALISDKKAVLASPDKELKYIFTTEDCKIQPAKIERERETEGPMLPSSKIPETEKAQEL